MRTLYSVHAGKVTTKLTIFRYNCQTNVRDSISLL
jgi:hypothetical protein